MLGYNEVQNILTVAFFSVQGRRCEKDEPQRASDIYMFIYWSNLKAVDSLFSVEFDATIQS